MFLAGWTGIAGAQVLPEQTRFSTHDSTVPLFPGFIGGDFGEFWADVKTPGDGWAYSVGSIEVRDTGVGGPVLFSGATARRAQLSAMLPFLTGIGPGAMDRQVVMLQQARVAGPGLGFQRFYYGSNPSVTGGFAIRATNARGVSVWPAATELETRIVICGETFDELLPVSNAPAGWPAAGVTGVGGAPPGSSGFIALFNGDGELLWSHHFFGQGPNRHCAITDVSVRVGLDDMGQPVDYVTFCGLSNYGNPAANATLTTQLAFAAPTAPPALQCPTSTGGADDNGPDQFDGIVGRLRHPHSALFPSPAATIVEYLSVVGGVRQDALFGIADIDEQRFAVVGATGDAATGIGSGTFPVTFAPVACPNQGPAQLGVVCVFRMDPGALVLEASQTFGSTIAGAATAAKDVCMQRYWGRDQVPGLIIVGSTSDLLLLDPSASHGFQDFQAGPDTTLGGVLDGFVLACEYYSGGALPLMQWTHGTYQGSDEYDFLTGVQGWNEFYDQFSVVGTVGRVGPMGNSESNIRVASYYRQPSAGATPSGDPIRTPFAILGEVEIGGGDLDLPAVSGTLNALSGLGFWGVSGSAAGGGISVDPSGRVSVVGATIVPYITAPPFNTSSYPVTVAPDPPGRASTGNVADAVRASFDLLPSDIGAGRSVGRTDGTGPMPPGGPAGGYPTSGFFGGTTPQCALTGFGHQIGVSDPQLSPSLPRMLLDWEGDAPAAGMPFALVVSRHPQQTASALSIVAIQLGFPGSPAMPLPGFVPGILPGGAEIWVPQSPVTFTAAPNVFWESIRFPLTLPTTPTNGTFTIQVVCLLLSPVTGGTFPACSSTSTFAATSGMWLNY